MAAIGKALAIDDALTKSTYGLFPLAVYINMANRAIEHKNDALEAFSGDAPVHQFIKSSNFQD